MSSDIFMQKNNKVELNKLMNESIIPFVGSTTAVVENFPLFTRTVCSSSFRVVWIYTATFYNLSSSLLLCKLISIFFSFFSNIYWRT